MKSSNSLLFRYDVIEDYLKWKNQENELDFSEESSSLWSLEESDEEVMRQRGREEGDSCFS